MGDNVIRGAFRLDEELSKEDIKEKIDDTEYRLVQSILQAKIDNGINKGLDLFEKHANDFSDGGGEFGYNDDSRELIMESAKYMNTDLIIISYIDKKEGQYDEFEVVISIPPDKEMKEHGISASMSYVKFDHNSERIHAFQGQENEKTGEVTYLVEKTVEDDSKLYIMNIKDNYSEIKDENITIVIFEK